MKSQEEATTKYISNRLGERRRGQTRSRVKNKCLKKAASAYIARRMSGVYRKDQEALATLTEEIKELFEPETSVRRRESRKMASMIDEALRRRDTLLDLK